jgi:lipoprotein-anchoring transpeptidase ErfK/SrfK
VRLTLPAILLLAACSNTPDQPKSEAAKSEAAPVETGFVDVEAPPQAAPSETMRLQVVLDRLGFSPGVIDGKESERLTDALKAFQASRDLEESGELDEATRAALQPWRDIAATRTVRIPQSFAEQEFVRDFPKDAADQAKLPAMSYKHLMEALAERFHTTPEALVALNSPDTKVGAGRVIRVPNIVDVPLAGPELAERGWNRTLVSLGIASEQKPAKKIVVDKSEGTLRVIGREETLIAQFPATMGSEKDPLPLGTWKINGVARNPDFHYNPRLFWDVSDAKDKQLLKPGPNSPVGVVWIDLNKPHYGIHGTSEPQTIGAAESHGCVRLTNWDAARLAQMVGPGVEVIFQA